MYNKKPVGADKGMFFDEKMRDKIINQKNSKTIIFGLVVSFLLLVFIILFISYQQKYKQSEMQRHQIELKYEELLKPQYDEQKDMLTEQCQSSGIYCLSVHTPSPSLEMLKFLVSFRETPNYHYRLFFEVRVGGVETLPYKLSCNDENTEFYICQEIFSAKPTDVIRNFASSYKALSTNGNYYFNLMVKPIGRIEVMQPVQIKPIPEAQPIRLQENNPQPAVAAQPVAVIQDSELSELQLAG